MKYYLIRHAQTDANRLNRLAFGKYGAPINAVGQQNAMSINSGLAKYGINTADVTVAVSDLSRTKQTAQYAGFKCIVVNPLLNEINTNNPQKTLELVAQNKVPKQATIMARKIINNPPKEKVWVTHGLVIAAIQVELGLLDFAKFIPDYCEIRSIDI